MFLALRLRIIINILNSSCSRREGTEGPIDTQGFRHTDANVWPHVIIKHSVQVYFLTQKSTRNPSKGCPDSAKLQTLWKRLQGYKNLDHK
jgi:hypothetical protein